MQHVCMLTQEAVVNEPTYNCCSSATVGTTKTKLCNKPKDHNMNLRS